MKSHIRLSVALIVVGLCLSVYACRGNASHRSLGLTAAENDDRVGETIVRCGVKLASADQIAAVNSILGTMRLSPAFVKRGPGSVIVPTVVHVVSAGESEEEGNVSDDEIVSQIAVLNDEYAGGEGGQPTPFYFQLESIDRTVNPAWSAMLIGSPEEREAKTALRVGGPETLNLYISNPTDGTLGWATFPMDYAADPALDGVVIWSRTLPGASLPPYNEGDTTTHEVGHWLGLFHTFQGECTAENDTISDTPAEAEPAFGCPISRDSCLAFSGEDAIHNYMDYSDDSCLFEFTSEQVERMDLLASLRGL
ncbi:MAG: zinc metalloprotease [Bdellovibrionota bacterium]